MPEVSLPQLLTWQRCVKYMQNDGWRILVAVNMAVNYQHQSIFVFYSQLIANQVGNTATTVTSILLFNSAVLPQNIANHWQFTRCQLTVNYTDHAITEDCQPTTS